MSASEAYQIIILAMNRNYDKKNKFAKRIFKKSQKLRYFRVPEYEQFIIGSRKYCSLYARNIVHGKLPEPMHNFMVCEALIDPKDSLIKDYFEICKGNFRYETNYSA